MGSCRAPCAWTTCWASTALGRTPQRGVRSSGGRWKGAGWRPSTRKRSSHCSGAGMSPSWPLAGARRPDELASAARLRSETTLPFKWIAARVQVGTAKGAKSVLPHLAQSQHQRQTARALEPCTQLEFQSPVFTVKAHFIPVVMQSFEEDFWHSCMLSRHRREMRPPGVHNSNK